MKKNICRKNIKVFFLSLAFSFSHSDFALSAKFSENDLDSIAKVRDESLKTRQLVLSEGSRRRYVSERTEFWTGYIDIKDLNFREKEAEMSIGHFGLDCQYLVELTDDILKSVRGVKVIEPPCCEGTENEYFRFVGRYRSGSTLFTSPVTSPQSGEHEDPYYAALDLAWAHLFLGSLGMELAGRIRPTENGGIVILDPKPFIGEQVRLMDELTKTKRHNH